MSVQKTATGYKVRWREGGAHRARSFRLKADAQAWDDEVRRRQRLGPLAVQQLTTTGPTLGEWMLHRWNPEHGVTLAARTRAGYGDMYFRHVAPWFDEVPLREISVSRLREWQANRLAARVSVPQVLQARTVLSSVLRHAAESEAIASNPMALVRAPRASQRDEVKPLSPKVVEAIRAALAGPLPLAVAASGDGQRQRRAYTQKDPRPAHVAERDAALVSLLAYARLRPSEALALRWSAIGERTILVERASDVDGSVKTTKGRKSRSVRLLKPLAHDLKAWRLASGRPDATELVFPGPEGTAWTTVDWANWRGRTWTRACTAANVKPVPRPYDLRHSFVSLLLAEGRSIHYVAGQAGHSPQMTLGRYGHVIAEYEDRRRLNAEAEIRRARIVGCAQDVPNDEATG